MRLKKYLPEFISSIKEFQELDKACSMEIDELREKLSQIQNNQFIETASHEGLRRYEQLMGLPSTGDIELRRFNILNKYNSTIPFTMMWLSNILNTTLGKGDFLLDMNHSNYTLTISIVKSRGHLIEPLIQDLRRKIPANLILIINILSSVEQTTHISLYIQTGDNITI